MVDSERGSGIASQLYEWIVFNVGPLLSDWQHYIGARALWSSLCKTKNMSVDMVDLNSGAVKL